MVVLEKDSRLFFCARDSLLFDSLLNLLSTSIYICMNRVGPLLQRCRPFSSSATSSIIYPQYAPRYLMNSRPLDFHAGPLVWVDCEMTGLNPRKDKILEIAVRLSTSHTPCL